MPWMILERLSVQLCHISHYVSALGAAHVVPCSHMGFKPRMRAGAGSASALERKQTQTTSLILP